MTLHSPSKMTHCTTLSSASLFYFERKQPSNQQSFFSTSFKTICSISTQSSGFESSLSGKSGLGIDPSRVPLRPAVSLETSNYIHQTGRADLTLESPDDVSNGTVKQLLSNSDGAAGLMKMERRSKLQDVQSTRWFPYLDEFKAGGTNLSSGEILEVLDPYIVEARKEKFRNVVKNRTYSVCLVLEDLSDLTNVSAVLRSADALGFQSVHVISGDSSKRYRGHRHVSKGAERWLDIELWKSTNECYRVLKSRGYRIAATHVGMGTGMGMEVSINDMDWSCPTAIVFGNETRGITDEALDLSDLRCSVPMRGMVNSLNVAAAANIFMYHAVCDRTSCLSSLCVTKRLRLTLSICMQSRRLPPLCQSFEMENNCNFCLYSAKETVFLLEEAMHTTVGQRGFSSISKELLLKKYET